jgi:hypothetical protein
LTRIWRWLAPPDPFAAGKAEGQKMDPKRRIKRPIHHHRSHSIRRKASSAMDADLFFCVAPDFPLFNGRHSPTLLRRQQIVRLTDCFVSVPSSAARE